MLEHLKQEQADLFLAEQHRVLKRGGIIRVVVPDLEPICHNYLKYLEELLSGDYTHEFHYDYSLLELYDQVEREESGGRLRTVWAADKRLDISFVADRHGTFALDQIKALRGGSEGTTRPRMARLMQLATTRAGWLRMGKYLRLRASEVGIFVFMGTGAVQAYRAGLFRASGEVHHVMYDRFSLQRLLLRNGFERPSVCTPTDSLIPGYAQYHLDESGGAPRKADSLFMEAVRP